MLLDQGVGGFDICKLISGHQDTCDIFCHLKFNQGFPGDYTVKNLPAIQEIWVRPLGWEDPLEKEMATHSRILAWKIPRTEEPGRLQSMGLQRVEHD